MLNFVGCKILVVGDVMVDEYLTTSIRRISPEAPVPIAQIEGRHCVPGGAANVARNLACLGCTTFLAGVCGHDAHGSQLQAMLNTHGIHTLLVPSDERPTTTKTRIVSSGQQLLRLDREETGPLTPAVLAALWGKIESCIGTMDAVILSDYGKGVLQQYNKRDSLAKRIISACHRAHVPVLVDPKGTDWARYAHADCITPNMRELAAVIHTDSGNIQELLACARPFMNHLHVPRMLLTMSENGVALMDSEGGCTKISAQARDVADVSGAGDTVIAVLAACIAKGFSWNNSAAMANLAGGIVVGKAGTSPIELAELRKAHHADNSTHHQLARLNDKIHTLKQLLARIELWRHAGKKIVFTNGCFDLLHMGHVQLIEEAAAQGDKLVVALNSDASIRRLKGAGRPVQSEKARCIVMAALEEVDAVIVFDEDTPLRLIEAISPDVLVKGADYAIEDIAGSAHVRNTGGIVHLVQLVPGFSTTAIINTAQKE